MKKSSSYSLILVIMILIGSIMGGCNSNRYQATKYLSMVLNNDSQQRLITIGKFKGTLNNSIKFEEAKILQVEMKIEQGDIEITFFDVNDQPIFEKTLREGESYIDTFEDDFKAGTYELKLSSKMAREVEIKLIFKE